MNIILLILVINKIIVIVVVNATDYHLSIIVIDHRRRDTKYTNEKMHNIFYQSYMYILYVNPWLSNKKKNFII